MSVFTTIKKAIKTIGSTILSGPANQSAAVVNALKPNTPTSMTFPVGQGLTPAQTTVANQKLGIAPKTGLVDSRGNPVAVPTFGTTPVNINNAIKSGGLTTTTSKRTSGGSSSPTLAKASAPSSVTSVPSGTSTFNLSGGTSGTSTTGTENIMGAPGSSTANAQGALAKTATLIDQQIADAEKARQEQVAVSEQQKKGLLNNLLKQNQPIDIAKERVNLEEQYQTKAQIAEINSLQDNLNKVETEQMNQVAAAQDKLGSMNFINNQVQQIQRNSEPMINRLRADINFRTGILNQDRELIAQAISDATATSRSKWERATTIYNENKDIIDNLDKPYADAFKLKIQELQNAHEEDVKLQEWKRDMIIEYGLKNTSINDSEQTILEKIRAVGYLKVSDRSGGGKSTVEFRDVNLGGETTRIFTDKNGNEIRREVLGTAGDISKETKLSALAQQFASYDANTKTKTELEQDAISIGLLPTDKDVQALIGTVNTTSSLRRFFGI